MSSSLKKNRKKTRPPAACIVVTILHRQIDSVESAAELPSHIDDGNVKTESGKELYCLAALFVSWNQTR